MPIIERTDPIGQIICFDSEKHYYYDDRGTYYKSATRLLKTCFSEFDTEKVATRVAVRDGKTIPQVKKEWALKGQRAAEKGTLLHAYAESRLFGLPSKVKVANYSRERKAIDRYVTKLLKKGYRPLASELIVFDRKLRIAGTIDAVLLSPRGSIVILDWKSNEKFSTFNRFQTGLGALSHLTDCHLDKYSLQLNLYRTLVQRNSYFRGYKHQMLLVHISDVCTEYWIDSMDDEMDIILSGQINK